MTQEKYMRQENTGGKEKNPFREWCVSKGAPGYPQALMQIRSAPRQIYVRGQLPEENAPAVAIIGARQCSSYGREMAQWFAGELAAAGVQIISGMARGVDGAAQLAALKAGGRSFGVLGCGTDICYPKENQQLYELLLERGGVLSEYPAGTPPLSCHFPGRNRIISALSDCVLVIEAKERSGTLITADFALEQGKDVFALPGRLTDRLSCGCNRLLAQGAGIVLTPQHLLELLYGKRLPNDTELTKTTDAERAKFTGAERTKSGASQLSEKEKIVWEQMGERSIGLQELYEKIRASKGEKQLELAEITDILMELIMKEIILPERGNKYRRKSEIGVSTI